MFIYLFQYAFGCTSYQTNQTAVQSYYSLQSIWSKIISRCCVGEGDLVLGYITHYYSVCMLWKFCVNPWSHITGVVWNLWWTQKIATHVCVVWLDLMGGEFTSSNLCHQSLQFMFRCNNVIKIDGPLHAFIVNIFIVEDMWMCCIFSSCHDIDFVLCDDFIWNGGHSVICDLM